MLAYSDFLFLLFFFFFFFLVCVMNRGRDSCVYFYVIWGLTGVWLRFALSLI